MDDPRFFSLKDLDEDISAMLKLNKPPIKTIDEYLREMEVLVLATDSGPVIGGGQKSVWTSRLNMLKKEFELITNYNLVGKELFALQFYITTLFQTSPTSDDIKPNIEKFNEKIKKIEAVNMKNKWNLVAESLLTEYNKLKASTSVSGCVSINSVGVEPQLSSTEVSGPAFDSFNVLAQVSFHLNFVLTIL